MQGEEDITLANLAGNHGRELEQSNANARVLDWMSGVQDQGATPQGCRGKGGVMHVGHRLSAAALAAGRLHSAGVVTGDTSGARVLSQIGLNEKTVKFIHENTSNAMRVTSVTGVNDENHRTEMNNVNSLLADRQGVALPDDRNMMNSGQAGPINMVTSGQASGLAGLAATNNAAGSDGELSSVSTSKGQRKYKSGMLAKPTDNIKTVETWPHYNLHYEYAAKPVEFNQISFEQYIAGETKTIMSCSDVLEIKGRLNLMFRLAHLKQKGYGWNSLRSLYAAVVRSIEMHESAWTADWRHIEEMVIDVLDRNVTGKVSGKRQGDMWFCRDFNRSDGCDLQAPHEAYINKKKWWVKHMCATCWQKGQGVKVHAEVDPACPYHKD